MGAMRTLELPLFFSFLVVDIVAGFTASPFRSSSCGLSVLQVPHVGVPQAQRPARRKLKLNVLSASEDDIDDGIDEYKMELAEFMARAHEKRLEAMDAVKVEVQRGFEEQIAELQSKLAGLSAGASTSSHSDPTRVAELELSTASVASTPSSIHPSYAGVLSHEKIEKLYAK